MRHLLLLASFVIFPFSLFAQTYQGLGKESVREETIAKYAPPPLPSELSRTIQLMFDARSAGTGKLSPDGSKLYFSWRVTGTNQIWRLDRPNRFPVQMTAGEDRTELLEITPDGNKLIVSRDRGGEENPGLYWQA